MQKSSYVLKSCLTEKCNKTKTIGMECGAKK